MAQVIRTESEIYNELMSQTALALGVTVDELGQQYHVENTVLANQMWIGDLKISRVQENLYPDLSEETVLLRQGQMWLQRSPAKAVQGLYSVKVYSSNGASIGKDVQFISNADSTSPNYVFVTNNAYSTNGDVLNDVEPLPNPEGLIQLRALTGGIKSVLQVGDKLTCIQPLLNAKDEVVVDSVITQPKDAESLDSFRADVIQAMSIKNNIFSSALMRYWVSPISEIRTIYPYILKQGVHIIYVEATPENSVGGIVGQTTEEVLKKVYHFDGSVETGAMVYDEERNEARRPAGVLNFVVQNAIPRAVDIAFAGLNDTSKSSLIKSVIGDILYEIRPYISGAQPSTQQNDVLASYMILAAIGSALAGSGAYYTGITMFVDGVEQTNVVFSKGDYPYLRDVTNNGQPI